MPLKLTQDEALRGDTMIEVMFAIVVFAFIAVLTLSMMNLSLAHGENALELVTARTTINAQAEALRFIHSSYISERTLPLRLDAPTEAHQQYKELWETIVGNAISPADANETGLLNLAETVTNNDPDDRIGSATGCARVYEIGSEGTLLARSKAFILNTRDLNSRRGNVFDTSISYISAREQPDKFQAAPLAARIIFAAAPNDENGDVPEENSTTKVSDGQNFFNRVAKAEGIWIIAVADGKDSIAQSKYYDFYIQSCWYGPSTSTPTVLDTVIRLYNPEEIR